MDATDPEQGPESPSKQPWDLTPSSKGRQRKKNSKYLDYETDDAVNVQNVLPRPKRGRRSCGDGDGAATEKKTPTRNVRAKKATTPQQQKSEDGEEEPTDKTPQKPDENILDKTPKKTRRGARKTPSKRKTPAKRTPAGKKAPSTGAGGAEGTGGAGGAIDAAPQENGTPKPKRKYVRKQKVQQEVKPAPCEEPEEPIEPGGRRRRGAAKAALKYLHLLAKEVFSHPADESGSQRSANSDVSEPETHPVKKQKGARKGQKRKRCGYDSDAAEDEDFVPDVDVDEDEEVEEMEDEEAGDSDLDLDLWTSRKSPAASHVNRNYSAGMNIRTANGLTANVMRTVWDAVETNKKFREEHHSSWVFPEWVPSTSHWHLLPHSDVEKYLPQEFQSAAFKVSREGLSKEETPLQRLNRFGSLPAHPDRWDMYLYAGGPVWALEWCPTPDGAPADQYVAVSCHRGMDDQHHIHNSYSGAGLIQLWNLGKLEYNSRPDSQPALAYGLAQDKGFIWHLKWCPSGGWELPSCSRKAPFLPRLGLLAVATSTCVVTIYSLPHPDALHSSCQSSRSGDDSKQPLIYKAEGVLTLKLGALKSPRQEKSGQVLSMDWLPQKPHNIMAIGFYDEVPHRPPPSPAYVLSSRRCYLHYVPATDRLPPRLRARHRPSPSPAYVLSSRRQQVLLALRARHRPSPSPVYVLPSRRQQVPISPPPARHRPSPSPLTSSHPADSRCHHHRHRHYVPVRECLSVFLQHIWQPLFL